MWGKSRVKSLSSLFREALKERVENNSKGKRNFDSDREMISIVTNGISENICRTECERNTSYPNQLPQMRLVVNHLLAANAQKRSWHRVDTVINSELFYINVQLYM